MELDEMFDDDDDIKAIFPGRNRSGLRKLLSFLCTALRSLLEKLSMAPTDIFPIIHLYKPPASVPEVVTYWPPRSDQRRVKSLSHRKKKSQAHNWHRWRR